MIKAIETMYNGYRFRSRLEARWAVFFDTLTIPYEYEKEGFNFEGMRYMDDFSTDDDPHWLTAPKGLNYLPDFWLPQQDCWIEIKGEYPTEHESLKTMLLALSTKKKVYTFFGKIPITLGEMEHNDSAHVYFPDRGMDCPYLWCECPDCRKLGIEFDGRTDRLPCKRCYYCERILQDGCWVLYNYIHNDPWKKNIICPDHGKEYQRDKCPRHGANYDKGYNADSPRLIKAYTAARQARFEHGERP